MVSYAPPNNNSVMVEESNDLPQVTEKLYLIMLYQVYTSPCAGFELTTLVAIGINCKGSSKSNYHTITTTTALKDRLRHTSWNPMGYPPRSSKCFGADMDFMIVEIYIIEIYRPYIIELLKLKLFHLRHSQP